jgi:hypothetical protein
MSPLVLLHWLKRQSLLVVFSTLCVLGIVGARKGSTGGSALSSGGGVGNLKGIMIGVLAMIIGLIMIALAMTTIGDMLDDNTIVWADYPGATALWGMVPMMMGIGIILFGVLLGWIGYGGGQVNVKTAVAAPLTAIVMVLMAPIVIDFLDSIIHHADGSKFQGLQIFSMVPMLYAIGVVFLPGVLGYLGAKGKN